jgi:hypothetical protein
MDKIKIFTKLIPITFLTIKDEEFEADKLLCAINELEETEEDDKYGEYSIKRYEVSDIVTMEKLVKLGYAKTYIGTRMARFYCVTDKNKLNELRKSYWETIEKFEKNKEV